MEDVMVEIVSNNHSERRDMTLALQACSACRKQKRKCDKRLPICSLCRRIGRSCDYSIESASSAPTSDDFDALRRRLEELESLISRHTSSVSSSNDSAFATGSESPASSSTRLSPTNIGASHLTYPTPTPTPFPSMFFLDSFIFELDRHSIIPPQIKIPSGALRVLGSSQDLRAMVEEYFRTIQTYLPIVSKIRLYQHLSNPNLEPGPDLALLFMAMKLVIDHIPEGASPRTALYHEVKSLYSHLESNNALSDHLLQALVLICLYETGHAIYPAAYLSVGNAARIGHAMGLHERDLPQMIPRSQTWTQAEERRRVWWGVVLLDRFINLGHRGKPLATSDPRLEMLLPSEEASWDRGQMLVTAPISLSASTTAPASPFARTCQAARQLGQIIRHLDDRDMPLDFRFDEALSLSRATVTFAGIIEEEVATTIMPELLFTPLAISYSALGKLYDAYSCTDLAPENAPESRLTMQQVAIDGLHEVSAKALDLGKRIAAHVREKEHAINRLSPFVIDALYQATANFGWFHRESSDLGCAAAYAELKTILIMIDHLRWKVAGEYLIIARDHWGRQ